jgi:photosystem II stability/assembly factor-like uncharacterized protein
MNAVPAAAAAMAIIIALGSVGVLMMARSASRVSHHGPVGGDRYTVVTSLMSAKGGPLNACYGMPLPAIPIGCGGVEVTNVDVQAIPGVVTYKNGTVGTPAVMLVGTWDGRALHLTEQPRQTTLNGTQPQLIVQPPPPSTGKPVGQVLDELRRDSEDLRKRGIVMLSWGQAKDGVEVTLAVADPKSVQYLYDTYGRMRILGWLQPIGSQSLPSPTPTMVEKTPILTPAVAQVSAPSAEVVWSLFAGYDLLRSTDGGNMWVRRPLPPVAGGGGIPEMSFVSAQEGWWAKAGVPETQCNGQGVQIWHTTNGAATWSQVGTKGLGYEYCKQGLSFVDATHGFLAAWDPNHSPTIYRTIDGGGTWSGATLPDPPGFVTQAGGVSLRAGLVKGFGGTLLVAASWGGERNEYVFRSTDGGASWTYVATISNRPGGLAFVTASRWLKIGNDSSAFETTDAGKTWHSFATDYSDAVSASREPSVFVFVDELVGYGTFHGAVRRTVDGGSHWITLKTPWPSAPATPSATAGGGRASGSRLASPLPPQTVSWPTYASTVFGYSLKYSPRWFDLGSFGLDSEHYFSNNKDAGAPITMGPDGVFVGISADCFYMVGPGTLISRANIVVDKIPAVRYVFKSTTVGGTLFAAEVTVEPGSYCYRISMIGYGQSAVEANLAEFDLMLQTVGFSPRSAPAASPRPTHPPTG